MKRCNKIGFAACLLVAILVAVISIRKYNVTEHCRERYFSNPEEYEQIADILISHHNERGTEEIIIWAPTIDSGMLSDDERQILTDFLNDSRFEYAAVSEQFVEFGNTTGSVSIFFSREGTEPEPVSENHNVVALGDGWYCMTVAYR